MVVLQILVMYSYLSLQVMQVSEKVVPTLIDLAEITTLGDHKKLGDLIINVLEEFIQSPGTGRNSISSHPKEEIEELLASRQRLKWEKGMPKEDLHIKHAAALVVKLEGNSLFSSGDISGAASKYSEALALCPMRSLWRRAQAYDMLGLAKESLLDAILFINEFSQSTDPDLSLRQNKVPDYAERLVKKQMRAAWLFREAAIKHGGVQCEGDAGDACGQDSDDSEWETASESDVGNDEKDELGDDDFERKDRHSKSSKKDVKHGYNLQLIEDEA
ncbi:UNVERIFIED_CONTAM: hypothetical protein Sradi_3827400 [Sesamum radiatum]|uniref:Uncharacterized protein n=1 Tax=Sesamum radiatum TaxID=300843 RepID=A0AAW2Q162_SESRA